MYKHFSAAREPMNSYTHFIGAVLSIIGIAVVAVIATAKNSSQLAVVSAVIFLVSTLALYCTSSYYHYYRGSDEAIFRLRKLDHSMIYVLIAGSYTPMVLNFFPPERSKPFIIAIWIVAAVGILIKVFFFSVPRWFSTVLYVAMGWSILFDVHSLLAMPAGALALLAIGGLSYTIGGVIYAIKKPNLWNTFGFHELFHIFVIIGSFFHFLVVVLYIL